MASSALVLLVLIHLIFHVATQTCNSFPYPKFVDSLPIPRKLSSSTCYTLEVSRIIQKLHRDLPPTALWGFGGSSPGPTFEIHSGIKTQISYVNNLPEEPLLPTEPLMDEDQSQTDIVIHLHGGVTPSRSDGFPSLLVPRGNKQVSVYPNKQPAGTLWYHAHPESLTRVHLYAGLLGFYFIRDQVEKDLDLPKDRYEIPLVISDKALNYTTGELIYPYTFIEEFFGDVFTVNQKIFPYVDVEPRLYRFRILNACNARYLNLTLSNSQPFHQIGADVGFLPFTVSLSVVNLGPGERADILIDFTNYSNQNVILLNTLFSFDEGECVIPEILQFRVSATATSTESTTIPTNILQYNKPTIAQTQRLITLSEVQAIKPNGENQTASLLAGLRYRDPIAIFMKLGTVEIWDLINLTNDTHVIHLHLFHFFLEWRAFFAVDAYLATGQIIYVSPLIPPDPNEIGIKDSIKAYPSSVTRIIIPVKGYAGIYVYHCHMLEHEDWDMMRPFRVIY